jgi:CDP-diacylglycerol--serine O-phosphatidyltransferase
MVLPLFVCVIFFIALLIGYPWHILSAGSVLYLLSLALGWKSYRDHKRAYEAANAPEAAAAAASPAPAPGFIAPVTDPDDDDRPERLH